MTARTTFTANQNRPELNGQPPLDIDPENDEFTREEIDIFQIFAEMNTCYRRAMRTLRNVIQVTTENPRLGTAAIYLGVFAASLATQAAIYLTSPRRIYTQIT